MKNKDILKHLNTLYEQTAAIDISRQDKIVVFSDLHLGNGKYLDDFAPNGDLFLYLLENYYFPENFHLILNGDIEELYKFALKEILSRWKNIYKMFEKFSQRQALTKLLGNHDCLLQQKRKSLLNKPLLKAYKLNFKGNCIFICHGHQAGRFYRLFQPVSTFAVRFIGNPLGIKNYSVAFNSQKRYKVEKRVYDFARGKKILAMIGHTHRPLFESLSKIDSLKFKIESLCRTYPSAVPQEQKELEQKIKKYKHELQELLQKGKRNRDTASLYSQELMVPCLFNSGCCIGKNGITAIEISRGNIELVYWFDKKRSAKYIGKDDHSVQQLGDSDYYRVSLKQESLDYIFSRIKLLA